MYYTSRDMLIYWLLGLGLGFGLGLTLGGSL